MACSEGREIIADFASCLNNYYLEFSLDVTIYFFDSDAFYSSDLSLPRATAKDPPQANFLIALRFKDKIGWGYNLVLWSLRPSSPAPFYPHVHKVPSLSYAMP